MRMGKVLEKYDVVDGAEMTFDKFHGSWAG
jgi:hypothetical protein